MNHRKPKTWELLFGLRMPLYAVRSYTELVIQNEEYRNKMQLDIIDWLEKISPEIDRWIAEEKNIRQLSGESKHTEYDYKILLPHVSDVLKTTEALMPELNEICATENGESEKLDSVTLAVFQNLAETYREIQEQLNSLEKPSTSPL